MLETRFMVTVLLLLQKKAQLYLYACYLDKSLADYRIKTFYTLTASIFRLEYEVSFNLTWSSVNNQILYSLTINTCCGIIGCVRGYSRDRCCITEITCFHNKYFDYVLYNNWFVIQEHYSEMLPLPDDEDYDGHEGMYKLRTVWLDWYC